MKKKKVKITLVSAVVLAVAFSVFACFRHGHHSIEKKAEKFVKRVTKKLELDSSQEKNLRKMKNEFLDKVKSRQKNHQSVYVRLAEEVKKDALNRNMIKEIFQKRHKDRKEMHEFMMNKFIEFHAILTPEQRNTLAEKMKKRKKDVRTWRTSNRMMF